MNNHVEVELKYDGSKTTPVLFQDAVDSLFPTSDVTKISNGLDTFYGLSDKFVRYRRIYRSNRGELTIKQRKSDASTLLRKEVDLHITDIGNEPVEAFMDLLGAQELFTLRKDYILYEIECATEEGVPYELDIVMYKAFLADKTGREILPANLKANLKVEPTAPVTFIEIEVGKNSEVTQEEAMEIVGKLGKKLSKTLKLGKPLNVSLFEHFNRARKW